MKLIKILLAVVALITTSNALAHSLAAYIERPWISSFSLSEKNANPTNCRSRFIRALDTIAQDQKVLPISDTEFGTLATSCSGVVIRIFTQTPVSAQSIEAAFATVDLVVSHLVDNSIASLMRLYAEARFPDNSHLICDSNTPAMSYPNWIDGFEVLNAQLTQLENMSKTEKMNWLKNNFKCVDSTMLKSVTIRMQLTNEKNESILKGFRSLQISL